MSAKHIHLIGIGGVGMAGLAVLLKARGCEVSGCDLHATPRTRYLQSLGITVFEGHDPAHLAGVDGVIVTPAVPHDAPELVAARQVRYRGEVLAEIVSAASDSIAVCGSHGKTTTATWIARLLRTLGEDVAWAIGGETGAFPVAHSGKGPLVVEADESDGTLARYHATLLVVTNCEYDHPDHFKTRADYLACYETAKRQAKAVIESVDGLEALARDIGLPALDLAPHNCRNALMAAEVARRRGHSAEAIRRTLPAIVAELPDRRFQRIAEGVYTDYAHHPTEMRCAIDMARAKCRGVLRVLFQPHRYSRTKALLADFASAFDRVDEVILCPTYAAFEQPVEGGDVADLYAAVQSHLAARGRATTRLSLSRTCEEAWEHARHSMKEGDLTLLLGAGDIINLAPRIQSDASRSSGLPGEHPI